MMTVRFPSGFSVQYNNAAYVTYGADYHILRTEKDGKLIAIAPSEAIVEFVTPCLTYNANGSPDDLKAEVAALRKDVRSLTRKLAAR